MKRNTTLVWLAAMPIMLVGACAVDVPQLMKTDGQLRARVMTTISSDSTLAAAMVEHLMEGDETRDAMLDKLFADGASAQEMMLRVATDRTRLDGVLSLAVQDSSTKEHVLALLKGMQMATAK